MSAYQKLIEFQDEVEHLTGVRPIIEVKMYSHTGGFNDEGALSIRNALVSDSSDELKPVERHLEFDDGGKWTNYSATDSNRGIELDVHGPTFYEVESA